MTKAFNPHHEKAKKASIDKVAADEYLRYMSKDNQEILLEEHKGATHFAYTRLDDFMKDLKLPKRGEEIKDDELVIDILGEYISSLAEELHPNHPIKKRLKEKKTIDEKMQEISHIASTYLGLDARYVGQWKEMIKKNKGIPTLLDQQIGEYVRRGKTLESLNKKLYDQTFDKLEYYTEGTISDWLSGHEKFKPYHFEKGKELHLTPEKAHNLIDLIAGEQKMEKDHLDYFGIKEKSVKYKKQKEE